MERLNWCKTRFRTSLTKENQCQYLPVFCVQLNILLQSTSRWKLAVLGSSSRLDWFLGSHNIEAVGSRHGKRSRSRSAAFRSTLPGAGWEQSLEGPDQWSPWRGGVGGGCVTWAANAVPCPLLQGKCSVLYCVEPLPRQNRQTQRHWHGG